MNNIHSLPDGIHQLVQLEVLDLSYNFLTEHSFPPEFFFLGRYLFFGINHFLKKKLFIL